MGMRTFLFSASLAVAACLGLSGQAQQRADRWRDDGHWHGDIRNFHGRDLAIWRGGHWMHGTHGGRLGWWWVAGGGWYFYPAPVYPYPDPYVPPAVVVPAAPAPAAPRYWYYCANPSGYFPYVPQCNGSWQAVVPRPQPPPPPPG